MLGVFAALALTPPNRPATRRSVVLVGAGILFVGLNFTSMVAFAAIVGLFEFGGVELFRGRYSSRTARALAGSIVLLVLLLGGVMKVVGQRMGQFVFSNLVGQGSFALGIGETDVSILSITLRNIQGYAGHLSEYPLSLVWGDGFSAYGLTKGGDIGWVESLARFGMPFFLMLAVGLTRLIVAGVRGARATSRTEGPCAPRLYRRGLIEFAVSVILMALIMDVHYSVWSAKAVLPIVFFALAIFHRDLPGARRPRDQKVVP